MWLKWRLLRNGFSDKWEYVEIDKWIAERILSMGENPDPDLVAELLEEEGVIKFPVFTVPRWTRFEWGLIDYPPSEVLHRRIKQIQMSIENRELELKECLELLKKIESSEE